LKRGEYEQITQEEREAKNSARLQADGVGSTGDDARTTEEEAPKAEAHRKGWAWQFFRVALIFSSAFHCVREVPAVCGRGLKALLVGVCSSSDFAYFISIRADWLFKKWYIKHRSLLYINIHASFPGYGLSKGLSKV
jgi:hypothetical protein